MPFVEVFVPKGTLPEAQRKVITEELVAEVMQAEGAPDTPSARSISWLVFHEAEGWSVGGAPVGPGDPARFVVRVSVPAGSLDDAKRQDMVERITRVLAKEDPDPDRLTTEPVAWVHITEIAEGNWGAAGRVVRFADIAQYVASGSV
jgi:phenylpyruvate tautomerase PptA (4-oxalocrotonate tautomerase family)